MKGSNPGHVKALFINQTKSSSSHQQKNHILQLSVNFFMYFKFKTWKTFLCRSLSPSSSLFSSGLTRWSNRLRSGFSGRSNRFLSGLTKWFNRWLWSGLSNRVSSLTMSDSAKRMMSGFSPLVDRELGICNFYFIICLHLFNFFMPSRKQNLFSSW